VTFHVLLDEQSLQQGERVLINGSCACMSDWQDGVAMSPTPENPYIWSVTLDLPFTLADASIYGVFKFRYEILTSSGKIEEGQIERSEQVHKYLSLIPIPFHHSTPGHEAQLLPHIQAKLSIPQISRLVSSCQ
jgi:hypothetical protein